MEDQSVAHLVEEFNHLDMDDEPWSVKMVRLGYRIDLATEAKRQYKSSQRLLKELYEAGHKHMGLLGEDGGALSFLCVVPRSRGDNVSSSRKPHMGSRIR
ncbi:hypothetical protein LINPERPRIM_LOCUS12963 [Linum perenne]